MDFFSRQEAARKKTKILIVYFLAAIIFMVLVINAGLFFVQYHFFTYETDRYTFEEWLLLPFLVVTGIILTVIFVQTLWRFLQLRQGGKNVAKLVGARQIPATSSDLQETKLIHIVEEMSIAAGVPLPTLYVMDAEPSINAFVAGYTPTETVLVVTKGLLDNLNRHELQGVVGHEFSHILYGDMRINLYLISLLAGIVVIGEAGLFIIRVFTRVTPSSETQKEKKNSSAILMVGLILIVVGYAGVFAGRLIRAAVSRQREFLADASAVQFTREPAGIANALYKIKRLQLGSTLANRRAEEVSHMCFGQVLDLSFARNLFATHPPLDVRILAIDPNFDLSKDLSSTTESVESVATDPQPKPVPSKIETTAEQLTNYIGNLTEEQIVYAKKLHKSIPHAIKAELQTPEGAKTVIFALLLSGTQLTQDAYLVRVQEILQESESKRRSEQALNWAKEFQLLGREIRLPLIDLAVPALKSLPLSEQTTFLHTVEQLIVVDEKLNLFEYLVHTLLKRNLDPKNGFLDKVKYKELKPLIPELSLLLSAVAYAGGKGSTDKITAAYTQAVNKIKSQTQLNLHPLAKCTLQQLDAALTKLAALTPLLKQTVISACAESVLNDGIIEISEVEILRAIAARLDCPMPPLVIA